MSELLLVRAVAASHRMYDLGAERAQEDLYAAGGQLRDLGVVE